MTRPICPEHGITQPCACCRADHHAGEHAYPRPECPRCTQTPAPTPDAARAAARDLED